MLSNEDAQDPNVPVVRSIPKIFLASTEHTWMNGEWNQQTYLYVFIIYMF